MGDLLVRGGSVVDGTGAPAFAGDVRVRDGVIVEVGPGLRPDGETQLDAGGAVVAPGFIDVHTHYDGSIWWDNTLDPSPQHGVTTVLTGNCALSLAPVEPEHREALVDMFCFIEDIPVQAVLDAVPWNWRTWGEHRDAMNTMGASCNVAPLVGHNNIRLAVLGEESFERAATPEERLRLLDLTVECLRAGAYGVSLSFVDSDSRGRRVPSRLASAEEYADLASAIAHAGHGVLQYVPRFMKTDGYIKDIDRVDAACRANGVAHTYAPLLVGKRDRAKADAVLEHTRALRAAGAAVWPQVSPRSGFDNRIVLDGSSLQVAAMPAWVAMTMAQGEEKAAMLRDPAWREEARRDWESPAFVLFPRAALGKLLIGEVHQPELKRYEGKLFAEVMADRPGHPADVLADWILDCGLDPNLVVPSTADEDRDFLGSLLAADDVLLGASDAGAHLLLFCGAGDTTLFLTRYVRDRGDLSLEAGIHKLTGLAASSMGMHDRGRLAPGLAGDLVVFDPAELRYEPEAMVRDERAAVKRFSRPAGGYRATVVAGVPTQLDGVLTEHRPGRMLDAGNRPAR
jgi:N-acyl-D-amino-acid deacylase